ncbi:MAG: protein arginine kinase [Myxococcota bacterium]|jgi:protein arginine kinase
MSTDARLQALLQATPTWLKAGGAVGDIVVSSRVRLARNVADCSFPEQLETKVADDILAASADVLRNCDIDGNVLEVRSLSSAAAEFVLERNLASRELLNVERPTMLFYGLQGSHSVMVNEEDHFRVQGIAKGLDLEAALRRAQRLERVLATVHEFATSNDYGYLTSCPTNTGSGMRASIMLHLPALARAKSPLQRSLQSARAAGLAVRGVHGEGSRAIGHLYQISNQRTLGSSSSDQLLSVANFGHEVASYERSIREQYAQDTRARVALTVDLKQALKRVKESTQLTTGNALACLSLLNLGINSNVCQEIGFSINPHRLLQLSIVVQPGHLQMAAGTIMTAEERDIARADRMRIELGF